MVSNICSNRKNRRAGVLGVQLCFMVQELLVNLCKRWGILTCFNLVFNRLVFFGQAFQDELDLIFNIVRFTQKCYLIKASLESLIVGINVHCAFGPALDLLTQLLNMPAAGLGIGGR